MKKLHNNAKYSTKQQGIAKSRAHCGLNIKRIRKTGDFTVPEIRLKGGNE